MVRPGRLEPIRPHARPRQDRTSRGVAFLRLAERQGAASQHIVPVRGQFARRDVSDRTALVDNRIEEIAMLRLCS